MQGSAEIGVSRSQTHRLLEFPERVPPPPLLHANPGQVHMRKLARLVSLGLLRPFQPRDGLIELPLLHQVTTDVVVGVSEIRVDVDGAQALLGRLIEAALEAVGPSQEGVGLGGRVYLDRALIELNRPVELPPHLVLVGLLPDRGSPVEAFRRAHLVTRSARPRGEGPYPRTSTRSGWSPGSGPASPRVRMPSAARPPCRSRRAPPERRRQTPRRRRCRSNACTEGRRSRPARAPCRPRSRSSSRSGARQWPREMGSRRQRLGGSSCRRGSSAPGGSGRRPPA